MRGFWGVGPALSVALLIGTAMTLIPAAAMAQDNEATAAVRAREIAFAKSMEDRDLEAFRTFISPEAIFFNGNQAQRGRDAIVRAWASLFEGEAAPFSWRPDVTEVLDSGRLALSSGPVFAPSGEETGRFNSIWRLEADGQWMVVFDKGS